MFGRRTTPTEGGTVSDLEILRLPDVLGVLRQWEADEFCGGILTPAVLADKLQDHGFANAGLLTRLRTKAMMATQYVDLDSFRGALAGIPASLDSYDWREAFKYATKPDPCPPDSPGLDMGGFDRDGVAEVFHLAEGINDEAEWVCVGRLKDGRFFSLRAGCDYTGWG